jgi:hypothetical protein
MKATNLSIYWLYAGTSGNVNEFHVMLMRIKGFSLKLYPKIISGYIYTLVLRRLFNTTSPK